MDSERLKETLLHLHDRYGIDKVELSKVMIIASTTLMIVSVHATLSFQSSLETVQDSNQEMEQVSAIVSSENFQSSLDTLDQIKGSAFGSQVDTVVESLREMEKLVENSKTVENDLEKKQRLYQWIVLISILGNVAGVALFYI